MMMPCDWVGIVLACVSISVEEENRVQLEERVAIRETQKRSRYISLLTLSPTLRYLSVE
jgi:hypothetical protein